MDFNEDDPFENTSGSRDGHPSSSASRVTTDCGSTTPSGGSDSQGAIAYALGRLAAELAPELTYHNLFHTQDDVMPAVRRLAVFSGVRVEELALLEVAAAFHDLGYLVQREEHERAGAVIAWAVLPGFGFTRAEVAAIQGMILATRLPQSPRTLLEQVLADADLDSLGRLDSLPRAEALREELAACGHPTTDADWFAGQIAFMREHHYFTPAARALRDAGKRRTIAIMEAQAAENTRRPG